MSSGQVESEHFLRHRPAATSERSGREIRGLSGDRRAEALASRRQRSQGQPPVRFRIEGFILGKSVAAPVGIRFFAFAANVQNQSVIVDSRAVASRGGQRWRRLPGICRRIVDVMFASSLDRGT